MAVILNAMMRTERFLDLCNAYLRPFAGSAPNDTRRVLLGTHRAHIGTWRGVSDTAVFILLIFKVILICLCICGFLRLRHYGVQALRYIEEVMRLHQIDKLVLDDDEQMACLREYEAFKERGAFGPGKRVPYFSEMLAICEREYASWFERAEQALKEE